MIDSLPTVFLEKCSRGELAEVLSWWDSLAGNHRNDVRVLLDRRHESLAYVLATDDTGQADWHEIPLVDDGLPIEDDGDDGDEWRLDYFQHLLDHPELMLGTDVVVRTFTICTVHRSAKLAATLGEIDGAFECSDGNVNCPIARFAEEIQRAQLIGYTTLSRRSVWLCKLGETKGLASRPWLKA